jgi:hypothetical protein
MMSLSPSQNPKKAYSWNNYAGCKIVYGGYKVDWSNTKYYPDRQKNIPEDHTLEKIAKNFIRPQKENLSIPGSVAKELFEFSDGFACDVEYDSDEIYKISEGILLGVTRRTDHEIEVTYLSYHHHNEPIETQELFLKPIKLETPN